MNELARSIQLLYVSDASPVIAVIGGNILFFNNAARQLFPMLEEGQKASALLPRAFLSCDDEIFLATAQAENHSLAANGVWYGGMLLLRIHFLADKITLSTDYIITNLRMELASMRLALEQLEQDEKTDSAALAVLRGSYMKLLRSCDNISLAQQLAVHKCVFRPVPMNVADWLKEMLAVIAPMMSTRGIALKQKITEDVSFVQTDPALLEQLLLNLLSNSIRYSAPGGEIQVRLTKKGHSLLLTVEDKGCGISPDILGRLFSGQLGMPALSLGEHKSLGLFVVWGVTAVHGGSMTASNRARGGASVQISLPMQNSGLLPLHSPQAAYGGSSTLEDRIRIGLADAL